MLLILSTSLDATVNFLTPILQRRGLPFLRFDTDCSLDDAEFCYYKGTPSLRIKDTWYTPLDLKNIWYRRPERLKCKFLDGSPAGKFGLEEWAEALECFLSFVPVAAWMNHPSANVAASHKLEQLRTAALLGLDTPDTLVTQDAARLRNFFEGHNGEVIAKPLYAGYVESAAPERDALIYTNRICLSDLENLSDLKTCPTLFQRRIRKRADIRITVVDEAIHAVELIARDKEGCQRCDIRRNNMTDVKYRALDLPTEVTNKIVRLVEHYGLRFGAIDMAIDQRGRGIL